jgi:hypothetical protein
MLLTQESLRRVANLCNLCGNLRDLAIVFSSQLTRLSQKVVAKRPIFTEFFESDLGNKPNKPEADQSFQ